MLYVTTDALIDNTTMEMRLYANSTNIMKYRIYPNEGYMLHDTQYDLPVIDEITGEETGEIIPGFLTYPSFISVSGDYDFIANERQLYTVKE